MEHHSKQKKKKFKVKLATVLLLVGMITFWAANRYLIPHVEVVLGTSQTNAPSSTPNSETYTATDMSYTSDQKTINIRKVTAGSSSNPLVYYVADVRLTDGTELQSAFAKNQFGTNIIDVVSSMAKEHNALLAINGDYYGFRKDGIIIRNGVLYRDVPAREGLALMKDGSMKVYDEKTTSGEQLLKDEVWNTLSFGPALVKNGKVVSGIESVEVDTNFGNHSIQGNQPRTGMGIINNNHFVFIVADGRNPGYSNGVTLTEFAQIFKDLGCTTAYNLDGGGSSVMVFMGNVINHPANRNGEERGTSDILYVS
jgi:exopolysaccharide biosynthesis protein